MTCLRCGRQFTEEQSEAACSRCGSFGGCNLVMCPHCGYEQPKVPAWVERLRRVLAGKRRLKVR